MRLSRVLAVAVGMVLLTALPVQAQKFDYQGTMTGGEEVPGPGDPDGAGTFKVTIDNASNELCYELAWQNTDQPTAAHIHVGGPNQSGRIMVDLDFPTNGPKACIPVDSQSVGHMTSGPKQHYVNVHTGANPDGAIRGQLQR